MKARTMKRGAASRLLGIILSLAIGAVLVVTMVAIKAHAQSRYDHDQKWVRTTIKDSIREKDRKALEQYYDMPVEIVRRPRHVHRERHYYDRWREARRDERHEHRETRVYGFVQHMTQQDRRDCHNGCCPPIENISRDHGNEQRSWNDAQLGWMKAVAVRYGSMYADVQNADARTLVRQCFRSSFNESWLGRNAEAAAQKLGGDGHSWTCRIIASPCIQPITGGYETPLKGDEKQMVEPPRR
jgi:hypothetical protein